LAAKNDGVWFALILMAGPNLTVHSAVSCPSAAAVIARLEPLLPAGAMVTQPSRGKRATAERAQLWIERGRVRLGLSGPDGRLLQSRDLPGNLGCGDAAEAAAVLLAAWYFQGRGDLPQIVQTPAPALDPPPAPASPVRLRESILSEQPPAASRGIRIGAGLLLGALASQLPKTVLVEVDYGHREGLGFRAQGWSSSTQSIELGPGRALWNRAGLGLGARYLGRRGAWGGELEVDGLASVLGLSGGGFAVNQSGRQLALGVELAVRGLRSLGPTDLWLQIAVAGWPGRHRVYLRDTADSRDLPAIELTAGAGIGFFVWP
jgi:hypothetical protein